MRLLTILCLVLLISCSQEPEVVTGPFLVREGITYYQDTDELVTGTVEVVYGDSGQLLSTGNYKDGELDGLWEYFNRDGNLTETVTYRNGTVIETNEDP